MSEAVNKTISKASRRQQKLAVKLLTYVLIFSSFVTLATSTYIIYSDYLRATNELDQSITQIEAGYQESISYSLWNFDSQQIKTQLSGILNFPGVLNVYIETKEGLLHSVGNFEKAGSQKHAFDLFFTNAERQYPLGVLSINLDYNDLYETLFYKAFNILASQFIKTFSVSLFILFIFQRLVTNRLLSMSHWANRFNLNDLDQKLTLNSSYNLSKNPEKEDEIDAVVNAINTMRVSLKDDIKKRESVELALKKSQEKLSIAVNNAELGFCEYNQSTDRFSGNKHFAKHLGIEPETLEEIENPIDWFKNHITGNHAIEQKERINQLVHGHMERIFAEFSIQCSENSIKHFDTTIQISEWDDNGLPATIVFCLLDKTAQINASKQAAELNYALEKKVAKRTEELTHEQVQSQAEIKKLEQQLVNFEQQIRRQKNQENLRPLQHALVKLQELIHPSKSNNDTSEEQLQQVRMLIKLLSEHLHASNESSSQTFDVVVLIQESLNERSMKSGVTSLTNLRLPFSLMLDSHKDLLTYCFKHCLVTVEALNYDNFNSQHLMISLELEGDDGVIKLIYDKKDISGNDNDTNTDTDTRNEMIILKMCHALLEERLNGSIAVTQEKNLFSLELRFSVNAHR
ncbi:MAG: PAS domain-containing protein [Oleispira sp.]